MLLNNFIYLYLFFFLLNRLPPTVTRLPNRTLFVSGMLGAFVPFVLFLSVIIPPIAAIYVIDALTRFRGVDAAASIADLPAVRWQAMFVWLGAVAIATLGAYAGWTVKLGRAHV